MRPDVIVLATAAGQADFLERVTAGNLLLVLLVFALVAVGLRYLSRLLKVVSTLQPRARFLVRMTEPAIRILVWFGVLLFAVQLLSPSQDAFRAAIGSAALAIGLGAQDLIKNLIGGLVVLTDRPFQAGDRVRIGDAYGEVEQIGLRSTRVVTPDQRQFTIPNAQVLDQMVLNANAGRPEAQVVTEIFLPPDTDPDLAVRIGEEALISSPYLLADRPVKAVLVDAYSENPYLIMRLKGWVYDHRFEPDMQSDLVRRVKRELIRQGVLAGWKGE